MHRRCAIELPSPCRENSISSALFDLVNHFSVDYLKHLAGKNEILEELQRLSDNAAISRKTWIEGSLTLLSLINEGQCRCKILVHGIPASPVNLEKSHHMINVDKVLFFGGQTTTASFKCSYCGMGFKVTEFPGSTAPQWKPAT